MKIRTTKNACSLRKCVAIVGVLCFAVFKLYTFNDSYRFNNTTSLLYDHHYYDSVNNETEKVQGQEQNDTFILESFAISFDPQQVEKLQERNQHANLGSVLWVPGTDGMHQRTLNLWAQITNHQHPPMTVEEASKLPKDDYTSPHAVGCYLAHWNLLRTLAHRPIQQYHNDPSKKNKTNKHAYLILEDDAACAPGLNAEIERTIEQLPSDWDMLFVGGKIFSSFDTNKNNDNNSSSNNTLPTRHGEKLIQDYKDHEASSNWTATVATNQLIRHAVCQGDFGKANSPLAPDGSRRLFNQAYWRVKYLTNTHSYVVNPKRVAHVARLLHPSADVPVDIRLGDLMNSGELNAFMTTRMWCDQTLQPLLEPKAWSGFFAFVNDEWKNIWQTQMHMDDENCAF